MNKPLILEIEEAKQELIQYFGEVLQKHGLNCYLLEPTVADIYSQVKISARDELAQAQKIATQQATAEENN